MPQVDLSQRMLRRGAPSAPGAMLTNTSRFSPHAKRATLPVLGGRGRMDRGRGGGRPARASSSDARARVGDGRRRRDARARAVELVVRCAVRRRPIGEAAAPATRAFAGGRSVRPRARASARARARAPACSRWCAHDPDARACGERGDPPAARNVFLLVGRGGRAVWRSRSCAVRVRSGLAVERKGAERSFPRQPSRPRDPRALGARARCTCEVALVARGGAAAWHGVRRDA